MWRPVMKWRVLFYLFVSIFSPTVPLPNTGWTHKVEKQWKIKITFPLPVYQYNALTHHNNNNNNIIINELPVRLAGISRPVTLSAPYDIPPSSVHPAVPCLHFILSFFLLLHPSFSSSSSSSSPPPPPPSSFESSDPARRRQVFPWGEAKSQGLSPPNAE